jgi:hypothetical protein
VALQLNMTARLTHDQREGEILTDLEQHFPRFAGYGSSWAKVPEGQDPPDFVGAGPQGPVGLELVEWLDGDQMGPAKVREAERKNILRVVSENWQAEAQPQNFNLAVLVPNFNLSISRSAEACLHQEFFACAKAIDEGWSTNPGRTGRVYWHTDFSLYPVMGKYFHAVHYVGGGPHGFCWIDVEEDGGAYDPEIAVVTLERAIDKKLGRYSTPEMRSHLNVQGLAELDLLVHGGFNAYRYNTPGGQLSLEDIAHRGAGYYASHTQRAIFDRVWFFHSLDPADDVNALLGYPAGAGRVRWLAQLWPDFIVGAGSIPIFGLDRP